MIQNLFAEAEPLNPVDEFSDSQWQYLPDYNNLTYTNGRIQFDTLPLKSQWVNYRTAYLAVPITVAAATTDGSAWDITASTASATEVVVKNSILSLIQGLVINTGTGTNIVNENNAPQFINNIRLLVDNSVDWTNNEGALLQFNKDTVAGSGNTSTSLNTPAIANLTTSTVNGGWTKRFGYIINQSLVGAIATTSLQFTAILPLRLLHDVFEQMDFPLINLRFQMNFLTSFTSGTTSAGANFFPMAATPTYSSPVITIANGIQTCRLYYEVIKFGPKVGEEVSRRMNAGFDKTIKFLTTDYNTTTQVTNGNTLTYTISPGTVRPVRIWAMLPVTASFSVPTGNAAGTAGYDGHVFPLVTCGILNNINIQVNSVNYYLNNVAAVGNDWEAYELLRQEMPGYGESNVLTGGISYSDWLINYRIYVFNVSRAQTRLRSPNDAVSLQITALTTTNSAQASTLMCLTEREQILKIRMSSSDVEVVVGINAY